MFAKVSISERLEVIGQKRAEHEEAPHAVDDRGNAGEQFDRHADRAPQPLRAEFGEEDRDAKADRNRDHHRDHRGHQRAVERAERAEHRRIGRRRPPRRQQEGKSECPHRRPGARDQRQNDAAENQQHRNRADAGDPVKSNVAELESVERLGAIVRSGGFHHIALNGHVCHANPLTCLARSARAPDAMRRNGELPIRGRSCLAEIGPGSAERRTSAAPHPGHQTFSSALDVGRPGLLDQLDHRIRHRNVVELFGHLGTLFEGEFEELDGFG